jgi:sialate O-acetylesterase
MFSFQVCCQETICSDNALWVPSTISSKSGMTITLTIDNSCVGKQLHGIRYLWRETPCPFKQAPIYSATDPNLPAPPYIRLF